MLGGGDPVGGGVWETDDGIGTLLNGVAEGTGAVQGVRGGDSGWIDGMAHEDTTCASGRVEMDLDNLFHGKEPRMHHMVFLAKGGLQRFPVEGCSGGAVTRTATWVHFIQWHVRDTMVILE